MTLHFDCNEFSLSNNFVSAFNSFSVERNFNNQTILSVHLMHQHRMQSFNITNKIVSASDRSKSNAIFLTLTIVTAFDDISIRCSILTFIANDVAVD